MPQAIFPPSNAGPQAVDAARNFGNVPTASSPFVPRSTIKYILSFFVNVRSTDVVSAPTNPPNNGKNSTTAFGLQHNPVSLPVTTTSSFIILAKGFTPRKYGFIP